jgi:transmembrane sensor
LPNNAAEWDARLRAPDCSEAERQAFADWRAADAGNAADFEALQSMLAGLRQARDVPEIRALREAALDTVAPLAEGQWRWPSWSLAAATVAMVAVGLTYFSLQETFESVHPQPSTFATAIGERSTTTLEDGSVAVLNTNTRLKLAFSAQERRVILVQGQALFDVAKDPSRPFVVIAGEQRITAIGTVFDVRLAGDDVQVTLIDGVVEVKAEAPLGTDLIGPVANPAPVRMSAGQMLVTKALATPEPPLVAVADLERASIWRQGRVFFDDAPLSEAVAEMNRYSTTQIVVGDAMLDRHRVNGMFRTGQQANFVLALEQYFPLKADRNTKGQIILKAESEG